MPTLAGVEWTELEDGHLLHRCGKVRCLVACKPTGSVYPWRLEAAPRLRVIGHQSFGVTPEFAARDALARAEKLLRDRPELRGGRNHSDDAA